MVIELLRNGQMPHPFYSRDAARRAVPELYKDNLSLGEEELRKLKEINELLQNPTLKTLVDEGKLTLGIIKPNVNMGKGMPPNDEEATKVLYEEIGRDNVVFSFSTQLTQKQIEAFYADVKEKYSNVYDSPGDTLTIWQALNGLLNSGPVTFVLLYRQEADAVTWWREKMGRTHPSEAHPESIRGKYGLEEIMPNNLTHGSDSIEGAKKEISVLKHIVSEITERGISISSRFPSEIALKKLGVLSENDRILEMVRVYDSGMRSESWIYAYQITYFDELGNLQIKFIKEKHIISMGGALEIRAKMHLENLERLRKIGIKTPETYGVVGATLYQEFVINDKLQEVLDRLRRSSDLSISDRDLLDQLIGIAARLDNVGALTLGFTGDLIFDADRGQFLYIDAGYDLGEISGQPVTNAFKTLTQDLKRHKDYIEQKYLEIKTSLFPPAL